MPRNSRSDSFSSESENDDSPEYISLFQSKKDTQKLEAERRNADVIQRKAKREKNREIDRKLKERAAMNERGKGSVGMIKDGGNKKKKKQKVDEGMESNESREPDELEKRMRRAMKEAEEEAGLESDGEEFMGINKGDGAAQENGDDDETIARNPGHLPDELFAAAFSSSSKRKKVGDDTALAPPVKKRRSPSEKKKDIVVGSVLQSEFPFILFQCQTSRSRAIRILPNSSAPPVPSTTPSKKINRFIDRALSLKNSKQNLYTKGWERRPGNAIYFCFVHYLSLVFQ